MKTKILAMYLPQYHTFKENDEWWGKGHTEWVSCKASKSLYKNHYQPRIPLNKNYYDLSTVDEQIKQAELAKNIVYMDFVIIIIGLMENTDAKAVGKYVKYTRNKYSILYFVG